MTRAISHRGPDDQGCWLDPEAGIALGHRRLSIVDLSALGRQPMTSAHGRWILIYNGEIYNFPDLRTELEGEGIPFRGHSDTEVILAAIERHGLLAAVRRFTGMFAFAVFDRAERVLHLVRDRLGEKPLYYGWLGTTLVFGSELKALRAYPTWRGEIDRGALGLFLRHSYVPAPYSIYKDIRKVWPGTILSFRRGAVDRQEQAVYWSAREVAQAGVASPYSANSAELTTELETLLRRSVGREMVADVPLGAFLSGGVDSSLIVALMQAQATRPVRTFTIGFSEPEYNEAEHARAVARHLGTEHTELYVTAEDALSVVPKLPALYDEPFSDPSQVPTFLVSELARRHVTVSLSGDGGDELFGGYDRYFVGQRLWGIVRAAPAAVRRGAARAIRALSPQRWDRVLGGTGLSSIPGLGRRITGHRLHKVADILTLGSWEDMYRDLMSHWPNADEVVVGAEERPTAFTNSNHWPSLGGAFPGMMYLDLVTYLPDDILVKVDRASMGVSLESRAPFLDHHVVEFAWHVPISEKVRDGHGKLLLRRLLDRYVPRDLTNRPKMGFGVPIDHWLRGPLRDWGAALLDPSRLRREGFFDPKAITQKWTEHLDGGRNWHYPLWDVLTFQAWLQA